ncbi:hypothetical protein [Microbacterium tumbae]
MLFVLLLAALSLWAVIATLIEVRRDGYRARETDWSRVAENDRGAGSGPRIFS